MVEIEPEDNRVATEVSFEPSNVPLPVAEPHLVPVPPQPGPSNVEFTLDEDLTTV